MTTRNEQIEIVNQLKEELEQVKKSRDNAYWERNQLVAALSKIYPSYLGYHEISDKSWDKDWMNIVYMELPTGQVSWHIHKSDLENFSHLRDYIKIKWDGHSTEEKYDRIRKLP
jgi:hypothetical protein